MAKIKIKKITRKIPYDNVIILSLAMESKWLISKSLKKFDVKWQIYKNKKI